MFFVDRTGAGRHLAQQLRHLRGPDEVVLDLNRQALVHQRLHTSEALGEGLRRTPGGGWAALRHPAGSQAARSGNVPAAGKKSPVEGSR